MHALMVPAHSKRAAQMSKMFQFKLEQENQMTILFWIVIAYLTGFFWGRYLHKGASV